MKWFMFYVLYELILRVIPHVSSCCFVPSTSCYIVCPVPCSTIAIVFFFCVYVIILSMNDITVNFFYERMMCHITVIAWNVQRRFVCSFYSYIFLYILYMYVMCVCVCAYALAFTDYCLTGMGCSIDWQKWFGVVCGLFHNRDEYVWALGIKSITTIKINTELVLQWHMAVWKQTIYQRTDVGSNVLV